MEKEITLEVRQEFLSGFMFTPESKPLAGQSQREILPGVLFIHGLMSDQNGYLPRARRTANELRAACLTFNLSGHGDTRTSTRLESLTIRDHLQDITAAYDRLAGDYRVDSTRIGICGSSYGAYLAAILVQLRGVRRILMRAPAMHGDAEFTIPIGNLPGSRADVSPSTAASALAEFDGEILILESGADEVIPYAVIHEYLKVAPTARHRIIEGATHALTRPEWRSQFTDEIIEFFRPL